MSERIARAACMWILCIAVWPAPALAQQTERPILPKGGVAPPAELLEGLPAEATVLYRPIPEAENAEVAYLTALSEFQGGMADCWPEDGRFARKLALKEREDQLNAVLDPADRERRPIDPQVRDAVLLEYRAGWDGILRAQGRTRCRFAIGIDLAASTPHVFAARQAAKVARLQTMVDLESGDLEAALGRLSIVLRLSRDLRPGGNAVCQIGSIAINASARDHISLPILRSPALRPEHCDRLIALWQSHEREGLDPFRAPIFPEAVVAKAWLAQLRSDAKVRAEIATMLRSDFPGEFARVFADLTDSPREEDTKVASQRAGDRLAGMTDTDFVSARTKLDEYFGRWWRFAPKGYAARIKAAPEIAREALGGDPFLGHFLSNGRPFAGLAESAARESFTIGAIQSLAAVRRWALTRGGPPPDLATATKDAGLPAPPQDPFSTAPLKLTFRDGSPLIHSVGPNAKYEGEKGENKLDSRRHGDWLIRLTPEPKGR